MWAKEMEPDMMHLPKSEYEKIENNTNQINIRFSESV